MEQNLANIQKLYYCDKLGSHAACCGNVATRQITMVNKRYKNNPEFATAKFRGYRCEEHAYKSTVNYQVFKADELDQSFAVTKINEFLKGIIGKQIISTHHGKRPLLVKYLKENCGVMCLNEFAKAKKWKFVYYKQIKEVL